MSVTLEQRSQQDMQISCIDSAAMPEPFLSLLSHSNYMTDTLSSYVGCNLVLNPLKQVVTDSALFRAIKLEKTSQNPVMFAWIEIYLSALPSDLVKDVVAGKEPLGRLLLEHNVQPNLSCESLCTINADEFISTQLGVEVGILLYGRNSLVRNSEGVLIADSFEILSSNLSVFP